MSAFTINDQELHELLCDAWNPSATRAMDAFERLCEDETTCSYNVLAARDGLRRLNTQQALDYAYLLRFVRTLEQPRTAVETLAAVIAGIEAVRARSDDRTYCQQTQETIPEAAK